MILTCGLAATKFGKIFKAYAKKKGIQEKALRFLFDGNRIANDHTPKMLEMEDGDEVNAVLRRAFSSAPYSDLPKPHFVRQNASKCSLKCPE